LWWRHLAAKGKVEHLCTTTSLLLSNDIGKFLNSNGLTAIPLAQLFHSEKCDKHSDHLSRKPGNVTEFQGCQGKSWKWEKSGNYQGKNCCCNSVAIPRCSSIPFPPL